MARAGSSIALIAATAILAVAAGCALPEADQRAQELYGDRLVSVETQELTEGSSALTVKVRLAPGEVTDAEACSILALAAPGVSAEETVTVSFVVEMEDGTARLIDYDWGATHGTLVLWEGLAVHPDATVASLDPVASASDLELQDLSEVGAGSRAVDWVPWPAAAGSDAPE